MTRLNPWTFGAVLLLTVVVSYILCTLFWYSFTGSSMELLNALFHGMDFRKIYTPSPFTLSSFIYVLAVLAVWAYVVGVVFAAIRNLLLATPKS